MRLLEDEQVQIDTRIGHGGLFKTPKAAQSLLASALNRPISVLENAGEGGAWGMSLLAAYRIWRKENECLEDYLDQSVFAHVRQTTELPQAEDRDAFETYLKRFQSALDIEREAVRRLS